MAIRKILRLSAVEEATGFKKSQIYNLMAKGQFPRPLRLSEQAVGWPADEVEQWQDSRERATGGWSPRDRKRSASEAV
jgi:prophage regulatory protein